MKANLTTKDYPIGINDCDIGRIGANCDVLCRYPNHGKNCQFPCNCSEDNCDPAYGCQMSSRNTIIPMPTENLGTTDKISPEIAVNGKIILLIVQSISSQ